MLEIDLVQHAIESWQPYETTDAVSDMYYRVIDLATMPNPTPDDFRRLAMARLDLSLEEADIMKCVQSRDDWYKEGSLVTAFTTTLEQIDGIIAGQQWSERV